MTKTRFSHAQCEHPSTKAARAKCRKEMRDAAKGESAATAPKPVAVTPTKKNPRKTAAPAPVVADETPADESATDAPTETAPAAEPTEVTPETWKEHKGKAAQVYVKGVEEPFAAQAVTGWSIKFLQFTDAEGKRQQIPVSTVERVTV